MRLCQRRCRRMAAGCLVGAHLSKACWMVWRWMDEESRWEKLLRLRESILRSGVAARRFGGANSLHLSLLHQRSSRSACANGSDSRPVSCFVCIAFATLTSPCYRIHVLVASLSYQYPHDAPVDVSIHLSPTQASGWRNGFHMTPHALGSNDDN